MTFTLVIKGNKAEATKSASKHGLDLEFIRETDIKWPWTIGRVHILYDGENKLNRWMGEDVHSTVYPPGSLLFWQHDLLRDGTNG